MPTVPSDDLTFRTGTSREWAIASKTEHVLNTIQRLLYMTPGTDIYNPDAGLDVVGRARRAYKEGDRDTEYENRVTEQINTYTDIIVNSVVCLFQNETLVIAMNATYDSVEFRLRLTSDPATLENLITRV